MEFQEIDQLFDEHFGRTGIRNNSNTCSSEVENDISQVPFAVSDDDDEGDDDSDRALSQSRQSDSQLSSQLDDLNEDCDVCLKIRKGCLCSQKCFQSFEENEIKDHVFSIREMSRDEKDMYIMGVLQVYGTGAESGQSLKRKRFEYCFHGTSICSDAFRTIFDIGKKALRNIVSHMKTNGITPRSHGNKGRKPSNCFSYEVYETAVKYIQTYADDYGLAQPAAPRGRDEESPIFLPASHTKKSIHTLYTSSYSDVAAENTSTCARYVGLSTFYDIWLKFCPHIKVATPRSDVCHTCEKYRKIVIDAVTEEEKSEATTAYAQHVDEAQKERNVYKQCVDDSKTELENVVRNAGPVAPLSQSLTKMHYTFDFAQSLLLPHHSRQIGQLYFTTPRKVHLFGIRMDGVPRQYNYVVDESETIGIDGGKVHGPDAVISMLHHTLQNYSYGEESCVLHADNCGGQNKNRYVLAYFTWRTMTNQHKTIQYKLMIPGHTRCLVDAGFGCIKKLYRRTDCDTMSDIVKVVQNSSSTNTAVTFSGEHGWVWRNWKEFLGARFKAVKGIQKYQHFRFDCTRPGVIFMKERYDSEEKEVNVLRSSAPQSDAELPAIIPPAGLSTDRQQYLHRFVRHLVRPSAQDITCPPVEE